MKRVLKLVLGLIGFVLLLGLGGAAFIHFRGIPSYDPPKVDLQVEVTPERVAQGVKISSMLCQSCHAGEDKRMTGKWIADLPAEFGKIYSMNITQDTFFGIGKWTDGEIYAFLRTGVRPNGKYAPVYMPKFPLMAEEDVYSIIAWLRSDEANVQAAQTEAPLSQPSFLVKFLCMVAFKPLPLPPAPILLPDTTDVLAHGKYLANGVYACFACHSSDFTKLDMLVPENSLGYYSGGNEMPDLEGNIRITANLTPDPETGMAAYTEEEFVQAVKYGKRRNGKQVRYPMEPHTSLTDTEAKAIYAFLRTVPPVKNEKGKID